MTRWEELWSLARMRALARMRSTARMRSFARMRPVTRMRPFARMGLVVAVGVMSAGCYRVRSELISVPSPPDDTYRCVQLELAGSGYAIVGADRASGWIHAQRHVDTLLGTETAEIYATVIPDDEGGGSHIQLSDNSYAKDDADQLRASCAGR